MPRTKVSKNTKRNRDAAIREEKIREFDSAVDQTVNAVDIKIKQNILEIESEINLMKVRIPQKVLLMKIGDLLNLAVSKFSEIIHPSAESQTLQNQSSLLKSIKKSTNDEGYLTEDSTNSAVGSNTANLSQMRTYGRTPGPLSSAKARRPRRSRSACGYTGSALKPKPSANTSSLSSDRVSRNKLRTPMKVRQKALSADRTPVMMKDLPGSPTALLRWPKPGEMVISMTGTPVVSHVMPENYANVNIPIRDGVLSLRPKKLQNLDPELVNKIDSETLGQIKLLQSNLELLMSYVHKPEQL